jgi:phosphoheptose isomerase
MSAIDDQVPAALVSRSHVGFPLEQYESASSYFTAYTHEIALAAKSVDHAELDRAAAILVQAYTTGRTVFACGNGGSAAIANHLQCDHLKGIRTGSDLAPRVVSLSANTELLTAIANDIRYDEVFAYQLQSQSAAGDVLIVISSSGRSPSVVRALTWARGHGLRTIALTGFEGGDSRILAEVSLHIDATNYGVIEELHQGLMHVLAQYIRQSRMTPDAVRASVF